jgi:hypothetical protein
LLENVDIGKVISEMRLEQPHLPTKLALQRKQRYKWSKDRLVFLAIDHPARRVVSAGGDPWAMANRADLLRRTAMVLSQPEIDGILATPDIMDELFLLNEWVMSCGEKNFLDEKLLIGSMNRAGLQETTFELDDFVTAYTAKQMSRLRLDGGKLLFRLDPNSYQSFHTMRYCVEALNQLSDENLPVFFEPLAVPQSTDELVRLVGIASALGYTSEGLWLKLPMVEEFERVAKATTCPIVLLGGNNPWKPDELFQTVERCLGAGKNVRGLMIGRGILYPTDGSDPVAIAKNLAEIVHSKGSSR